MEPARHERQRQPLRRVRRADADRRRRGPAARRVPRAPQPLAAAAGPGRADRAALQPGWRARRIPSCRRRCRTWPGSISSSEAGQEYWAGDGADGRVRRRQPRADPPAHRARARRGGAPRHREPPQLRLARAARLPDGRERELIVHRKGATPAGAGVLGIIPGLDGHARLRRPRHGIGGVAATRRRTAPAAA